MAPAKQRSVVSKHLHSRYQPEEYARPLNLAGFDINDLASMLRTPSSEPGFKEEHDTENFDREASVESKAASPITLRKPIHPYQIPGSFENVAKNERTAVKVYLNKFIKESTKANDVTADQRFPMLWDLRERKLKELEDMGKLTMRTHPDRVAKGWKTLDDDLWVRKHFAGYLNGRAAGTSFFQPTATASRSERAVQRRNYHESSDEEDDEDQDDEEPDAPGIKREHLNDEEMATPRISARAAQTGLSYSTHLKLINGKAVARGFCSRAMLNEADGKPAMKRNEGVQRTWKWIDGKMLVWPAFETEQKCHATEAGAPRADSVVGEESKVVKQQADQKVEASSSRSDIASDVNEGEHGTKR